MSKLGTIDRQIFSKGDAPFDEKDDIYKWFEKRIDEFISSDCWGDRCFIQNLEVMLATFWHLSAYFGNAVVGRSKAEAWERRALECFDRETTARGDTAEVSEWRENIVRNFARLKRALDPEQ